MADKKIRYVDSQGNIRESERPLVKPLTINGEEGFGVYHSPITVTPTSVENTGYTKPRFFSEEIADQRTANEVRRKQVDEKVKQMLSGKEYAKLGGLTLAGAAAAGAGAYVLPALASYVVPGTVGGSFVGDMAGGLALGATMEEGQRAAFGQSAGDILYKQVKPYLGDSAVGDFVANMARPEYWVSPSMLLKGTLNNTRNALGRQFERETVKQARNMGTSGTTSNTGPKIQSAFYQNKFVPEDIIKELTIIPTPPRFSTQSVGTDWAKYYGIAPKYNEIIDFGLTRGRPSEQDVWKVLNDKSIVSEYIHRPVDNLGNIVDSPAISDTFRGNTDIIHQPNGSAGLVYRTYNHPIFYSGSEMYGRLSAPHFGGTSTAKLIPQKLNTGYQGPRLDLPYEVPTLHVDLLSSDAGSMAADAKSWVSKYMTALAKQAKGLDISSTNNINPTLSRVISDINAATNLSNSEKLELVREIIKNPDNYFSRLIDQYNYSPHSYLEALDRGAGKRYFSEPALNTHITSFNWLGRDLDSPLDALFRDRIPTDSHLQPLEYKVHMDRINFSDNTSNIINRDIIPPNAYVNVGYPYITSPTAHRQGLTNRVRVLKFLQSKYPQFYSRIQDPKLLKTFEQNLNDPFESVGIPFPVTTIRKKGGKLSKVNKRFNGKQQGRKQKETGVSKA